MITDIFARRYAQVKLRKQYFKEDKMLCAQIWRMLSSGNLWDSYLNDKISSRAESSFKDIHDILALELGVEYLSDRWWNHHFEYNGEKKTQIYTNSYATICKNFLMKLPDDLVNGDTWMKERLSLAELAFAVRGKQINEANLQLPAAIMKAELEEKNASLRDPRMPGSRVNAIKEMNARLNESFDELVRDLNERLRLALYPLSYHNGLIQISNDALVSVQIEQPFWSLVGSPPWANVDRQMKEAVDCRDTGDRMAAFHAVSALESCIKVISDTKGWTTGNERGAGAYISNLVSKRNGAFLEAWEGELLTKLFSDVRNPFAHGAGQATIPVLNTEQTNWAIDTSMSWIKTLVRRI